MSNETEWIEGRIFPVKCAGCHGIYDTIGNKACPNCGETDIVTRLEWSRKDFEEAERMIAESKAKDGGE